MTARPIALAALALTACSLHAQTGTPLQSVLTRLDAASATFTSAQATFHKDLYTALVKDHDLQDGITYTIRAKDASSVGIKIIGPGARTVDYKNGTARDFNPGVNCYNTYSAAKSKGTIESLLTLAFGASGKELSEAWTITYLGPDKVDGVSVEKLDLVPKEQGLRNNIAHIELWTDPKRAVSLKQVVFSPSGDIQTATYSNVRLNQKVDTAPFEIKGKVCGK